MPAFLHQDTDADVLYCAAPAVPAQLLLQLANHQKTAKLYVLTMSKVKNQQQQQQKTPPSKIGKKDIKNYFNLAPIFTQ